MTKSETRMPAVDGMKAGATVTRDQAGRFSLDAVSGPSSEEALVVDDRSGLSPAQVVENRLSRLLREATMPISHLQMRGMLRSR